MYQSQRMAALELRTARREDAARIAALSAELGYPATADEIGERLQRLCESSDHAVWVGAIDGFVVGWLHVCVVASVEYPLLAEIRGIVVDATRRGSGVGAALLAVAEDWARDAGMRELRVRSQVLRERAHHFYLQRGYVERKRQVVFVKALDLPSSGD